MLAMVFGFSFNISIPKARAADGQTELSTKVTYAKEWLNLNIFTWKEQSKVSLVNRYAINRASEIKTAIDQNNALGIIKFSSSKTFLLFLINKYRRENV